MTNVSDEFATAMLGLAEAYGTKLTEQRIRIYFVELNDLPWPVLRQAFGRALRESKFFPSIAELRGHALGSLEDSALVAWTGFQRAAEKVGAYAGLLVDDPEAARALLQVFGSWPAYCELDGPALGPRKAEFLAAYREARRTSAKQPAMRLPGAIGEGNRTSATWIGRLTQAGSVELERETFQLPAAGSQGQLPGGVE